LLRAALLCALLALIITIPNPASQPAPAAYVGPHTGVTKPDWITFTVNCARHYRVPSYKALGVAFAESSKGEADFRFCKIGRYYLPWGIHQYVVREHGWPVWDIYVQTEVAIRAIAYWMRKCGSFERAMHKYNATCDRAYLRRVREGERMMRRTLK
jgi:hypothetical protein